MNCVKNANFQSQTKHDFIFCGFLRVTVSLSKYSMNKLFLPRIQQAKKGLKNVTIKILFFWLRNNKKIARRQTGKTFFASLYRTFSYRPPHFLYRTFYRDQLAEPYTSNLCTVSKVNSF